MRLSAFCLCFVLLVVSASQAQQVSGVRITERRILLNRPDYETTYFAGDRQRREDQHSFERRMPDGSTETETEPRLAFIERCDIGQAFELNLDAAEYESGPYPPKPYTQEQIAALRVPQPGPMSANKTLRIEITTVDTGQRRDFFGHTARHVITTRKQIPLEGSHSSAQETVTDAWYIDLDRILSCLPRPIQGAQYYSYASLSVGSATPENPELVAIGQPETGFAVQSTDTTHSTITLSNGTTRQSDSTFESEVTEFQEGPLDPALFEVPPGFKQVDHIQTSFSSATAQKAPNAWDQFWTEVANRLGGKN
jgi:hypothetical protein